MPSLTIKNIPDDLLTLLRDRATRHHRSLQGELMIILEEAIARRRQEQELSARAQAAPALPQEPVRGD